MASSGPRVGHRNAITEIARLIAAGRIDPEDVADIIAAIGADEETGS